MTGHVSRRRVLTGGGLALGTAFLPATLAAAWNPKGWGATERANVAVANALLKAWETKDADGVAGLFAPDGRGRTAAHTKQPPMDPAAMRKAAASFFSNSGVQFKVLETVAYGPFVVNNRIDRVTMPTGVQDLFYAGVFYIRDGKIVEWSDFEVAAARPVKPGQPL